MMWKYYRNNIENLVRVRAANSCKYEVEIFVSGNEWWSANPINFIPDGWRKVTKEEAFLEMI